MMSSVIRSILEVASCVVILLRYSSAISAEILFKDSCDQNVLRNMSNSDTYLVKWSGEEVTSNSCVLRFDGQRSGNNNPYTICFDPVSFNIGNCQVQLFFTDLSGDNEANYTCTDTPGPWCAWKGRHAHMELHGADTRFSNSSFFEFTVTATKEDSFLYIKIGLVVSMVTAIIIGLIILSCCLQKRKQMKSGNDVMCHGYSRLND